MLGVITHYIKAFYGYSYIKSYLNKDAALFNYILPKVDEINPPLLEEIKDFINKAKFSSQNPSFYINHDYENKFRELIEKLGLTELTSDLYLSGNSKNVRVSDKMTLPLNYTLTDKYNVDELSDLLTECFGGWESERDYIRLVENASNKFSANRKMKTFVVKYNDKIVASGSVILDTELGIGYLHNAGVHENHRRKGLHTALIQKRLVYCLDHGVNTWLMITEDNSASAFGYKKLGFTEYDKFYFYTVRK